MRILSVETSCDETSIALFDAEIVDGTHQFVVLSHLTLSQVDLHRPYGGVYPNLARREHQANLVPILGQVLEAGGVLARRGDVRTDSLVLDEILGREPELLQSLKQFFVEYGRPAIDLIAVTSGPGLEPALWVGVNFARALSHEWDVPLVAVNHMEGHIVSVFANDTEFSLPQLDFPALCLLISGSHTEWVRMDSWRNYQKLGQTRDDAVGEAFDKVARLLGLPYPGGPEITRLANEYECLIKEGRSDLWKLPEPLPRPMIHTKDLEVSFSGLKTSVRYLIDSLEKPLAEEMRLAIAYEFEQAVVDVLVAKTKRALDLGQFSTLIAGGGVSANNRIRESLKVLCDEYSIDFLIPPRGLTGDNALMIGVAGYLQYLAVGQSDVVVANGGWSL